MTDFWEDKRVLITGIDGFVGSQLEEALHLFGSKVFGIDYKNERTHTPDLRFIFGDVRDHETVYRSIVECKPDVIFHLAAITQVVDSKLMPLQNYKTNIMGTANVLQSALDYRNISKRNGAAVVVASSDKAYGKTVAFVPASEKTLLNPYHPYDVSKASADFIARSYGTLYDVPVAITRCGNIYGPGDDNWQRIIPGAILALLQEKQLVIRGDGKHIREYNYIDDVINAYLLVAEYILRGGEYGSVWVISDKNSYIDVLTLAKIIYDRFPKMRFAPNILGEAQEEEKELRLDATAIMQKLGWRPTVDLGEGIRRTIKWVKDYKSL